MLMNADPN